MAAAKALDDEGIRQRARFGAAIARVLPAFPPGAWRREHCIFAPKQPLHRQVPTKLNTERVEPGRRGNRLSGRDETYRESAPRVTQANEADRIVYYCSFVIFANIFYYINKVKSL